MYLNHHWEVTEAKVLGSALHFVVSVPWLASESRLTLTTQLMLANLRDELKKTTACLVKILTDLTFQVNLAIPKLFLSDLHFYCSKLRC